MSKLLYVYFKSSGDHENTITEILNKITPKELPLKRNKTIRINNTHIGIINYNNAIKIHDESICNGTFKADVDWYSDALIDGINYKIQKDKSKISVFTDLVATKSLWRVQTEKFFAISTSQRMLINLLGNFEFNPNTIPWMLSSGIIGPESWDKRIHFIQPNQHVIFDIEKWETIVQQKKMIPFEQNKNEALVIQDLYTEINKCCENINNSEKTGLPLSGGYDSRCLLVLLKNKKKIPCISWGHSILETGKRDDTAVAKSLAQYYGFKHLYFKTDTSCDYTPSELIKKFLMEGEGRVDHIGAHMDGFSMWREIYEEGIENIIRGDEGFGWLPVYNEFDARRSTGLNLVTDFPEQLSFFSKFQDQRIPLHFNRKENESIETWRDRLYHEFRLPYIIAALNELVCAYVEVTTPFLQTNILGLVRKLSDRSRTKKSVFRKYVTRISPPLPFGHDYSSPSIEDLLENEPFKIYLKDIINSNIANSIFDNEFLKYISNNLKMRNKQANIFDRLRKYIFNLSSRILPQELKSILRKSILKPTLDIKRIALRITLICEMHSILLSDISRSNTKIK